MKNWIKVIFALNNKLDAFTYSIDSRVESLSALTAIPTMELFDNIIKLNDKKVRIINLRVLHDKMKEALSPREYTIIMRTSLEASFGEIANSIGISKGQVYRIYLKIVEKLSRILSSFGYTAAKFNSDYKDIAIIDRTYKRFARCDKAS